MMNKLKDILEHKRAEVAEKKTRFPLYDIVERLESTSPTASFIEAIRSRESGELVCIAEIKKASPSKGVIAKTFRPEKIAREYEVGGAKALSVLTDQKYFQGSTAFIKLVKDHVMLPVLDKRSRTLKIFLVGQHGQSFCSPDFIFTRDLFRPKGLCNNAF